MTVFFMVVRKASVIYQTTCALCRFVTFYMTHVIVFSSLHYSSPSFLYGETVWNVFTSGFSLFGTIHTKLINSCFVLSLSDLFYWTRLKELKFFFHQSIFCLSTAKSYMIFCMDANLWNLLGLYYFETEEYCDTEMRNFVFLTKIALSNIRLEVASLTPSRNIHHNPCNLYHKPYNLYWFWCVISTLRRNWYVTIINSFNSESNCSATWYLGGRFSSSVCNYLT
jgi:hypothetical protein